MNYDQEEFVCTGIFHANYNSSKRIRINQGGTYSGKTFGILQVLPILAAESQSLITITSQHQKTLERGAIRDFESIISHPCFSGQFKRLNLHNWKHKNGSVIEFAIFADFGSAKASGKRDYLFLNEANRFPYEVARHLIMRTRKAVFIDFNPDAEFWAHQYYKGSPDAAWFYSNYTHNPFTPKEIIGDVEKLKEDEPELYKIYGLGKLGNLTGRVFDSIEYCDDFPDIPHVLGMDFGFNNPTTLVKVGEADGRYYGQQLIYERGMTPNMIANRLDEIGISQSEPIYADYADPLTIAHLQELGWNVRKCHKEEVRERISLMRQRKWSITKDSHDWKKEAQNYVWKKDGDGKSLNVPVKAFDHAWDAAGYALMEILLGGGTDFL